MTIITFSCYFVMKNIRRICFISTLSRCMVVIGLLLTLRIGLTQTDTFDACSAIHNQQISVPSLIWKGNGSIGQEERTCFCSLYAKGNDVNVNIISLDIRMYTNQTVCKAMTINTDDDVVDVNCSSWIRPYHLLAHASHVQHVVIVIPQPSIHGQIWIQIQASTQLSLHCPPNESSNTVTGMYDVSSISSTNTHVTDTTQFSGHRKSTTVSEGVVSSSENGFPTQSYTTLSTSSLGTTKPLIKNAKDEGVSPGVLAGALVPSILIIAGILLFIVYFMRKRKKERREKENKKTLRKDFKSSEVYSLATSIPENIYLELEKQPTVSTDYDHATADRFENSTKPYRNNDVNGKPKPSQLLVHQVREGDYDYIGDKQSFQNSDYDTAASVAHTMHQTVKPSSLPRDGDVYSYDHLSDGAERGVGTHSAEYDTPASSMIEAAKLNSKSRNVQEDDYGYNHLGSNHQVKTIQNEYDTSASAVKAVAALPVIPVQQRKMTTIMLIRIPDSKRQHHPMILLAMLEIMEMSIPWLEQLPSNMIWPNRNDTDVHKRVTFQ